MICGIYLLLGSNVGDKRQYLADARQLIAANIGQVVKFSNYYESAAWGNNNQDSFLNVALEVCSELSPMQLLDACKSIESKLGRRLRERWGPREIDVDILYYSNEKIDLPTLIVPHPEISGRRFTLEPLVEIAPEFLHPILHKTNRELLSDCSDRLSVRRLDQVEI